ncbi:MAG: hypothetical protein UE630_01910 [Oscillospiraceae bacterium]|nr:hypothetical protein [Oscillospiraceae bacterium]
MLSSINVAATVTGLDGMVKVYFPPPWSVRSSALPFLSVTVSVSSA